MPNSFNITFGELSKSIIPRTIEKQKINKIIDANNIELKAYFISGIRGSGKTILLTLIKKDFLDKGYLCVDLNPYEEMQEQFTSKLYDEGIINSIFSSKDSMLLEQVLACIQRKNKRILITIDDISLMPSVRNFLCFYKQLVFKGYPVFLLMTGLHENISRLEKDKQLSFLNVSKLYLEPLDITDITYSYKNLLSLNQVDAAKYAKLTNGYAYAYQLLGSLLYKNEVKENLISVFEQKLNENAYSIIWNGLTKREKDILLASVDDPSQKCICEKLSMTNGALQNYKKRLVNKGIIVSESRGEITYALPRFKAFLELQKLLND